MRPASYRLIPCPPCPPSPVCRRLVTSLDFSFKVQLSEPSLPSPCIVSTSSTAAMLLSLASRLDRLPRSCHLWSFTTPPGHLANALRLIRYLTRHGEAVLLAKIHTCSARLQGPTLSSHRTKRCLHRFTDVLVSHFSSPVNCPYMLNR